MGVDKKAWEKMLYYRRGESSQSPEEVQPLPIRWGKRRGGQRDGKKKRVRNSTSQESGKYSQEVN